ncbi:MAG TPA: GNAT family N-acetyltransferase [Chloroflexia bacterium]
MPDPDNAAPEFVYRDATAEDRDEVLAFTANTWEWGDYIHDVYNDWLADTTGRFLVAVEVATGRIAALDKLSFIRPSEAWFEGLRVNPDFRGRGLASRTQRHMIEEARRLGARTIRFLTRAENRPVHIMAYRDGFNLLMVTRFWRWQRDTEPTTNVVADGHLELRPATPDEAESLYDWWQRSAASASAGLTHREWRFESTTPADWEAAARMGTLFVATDYSESHTQLPPPTALVNGLSSYQPGETRWSVGLLCGQPGDLAALARSLVGLAASQGVSEMLGFFPDSVGVYRALEAAGLEPDANDERYCLFELLLES